jgi:hypothetical protein
MASCNFCGKTIETQRPMVLVGTKRFVQGAGNGRQWVGEAPSVRYWHTFALLSVGVCPECVSKVKKNKLIVNLIVGGLSIVYIVLFLLYMSQNTPPAGFLTTLSAIIFLLAIIMGTISIVSLIGNFFLFRNINKTDEIAAEMYRTNKIIPKNAILAVVGSIAGEEPKDINIKDTMIVKDPYLGSTTVYDLELYAEDELDSMGKLNDNKPNVGFDEASLSARKLFGTTGV